MTVKNNRVDVRYHMNTFSKPIFGCRMNYQKLKKIIILRSIRKEYRSFRETFNRDIYNDFYKSKYRMEC